MVKQKEHWVFRSFLSPSYYMLKNVAQLPDESFILLHLWSMPSFEDAQSWIVYYKHPILASRRKDPQSIPFVKEIQWDYETSGDDIQATLKHVREAPLQKEIFLQLLDEGHHINIPLIDIPQKIGNDGMRFGIEMPGVGFGSFRLTWWNDGPSDWHTLTTWFHTIHKLLSDALDQHYI